jgi:hypothetical protein
MDLLDQQLNLMTRGRFEEAFTIAEKINLDRPDDLRGIFNRGWFLLNQGNFTEGYQCLEAGRLLNVYGNHIPPTNKPIWNQEDLIDKTVIINLEGGFGDQIIFARFAEEVSRRGGRAVLCADPSLLSLLSRIPGVSSCITTDQVSSTRHDFWIPSFSCSWLFGNNYNNLPNTPYISVNPQSDIVWKEVFTNFEAPKIGIRWSGNPEFEHHQNRIFPAEKLTDMYLNFDHLKFISLQRDNDVKELPTEIMDLQHMLISWEDTAAAINNLDLVITSCTSIAHLASAMGKPTWVIVPILPYHVWAYGNSNVPWYQKTTKIYRQSVFGEWDQPFLQLYNDLNQLFPKTL